MTDDRGATALGKRLHEIEVDCDGIGAERVCTSLDEQHEETALAILGERGMFLPDGLQAGTWEMGYDRGLAVATLVEQAEVGRLRAEVERADLAFVEVLRIIEGIGCRDD